MKVCIARNAEARTNAAISRIANALSQEVDEICLLTRSRFKNGKKTIEIIDYISNKRILHNHEIRIKSEPGKGITNIFQLLLFQALVLKWFLQNKDKYDVIHAFDLDVGLPAYFVSIFSKKKYIYHIADFYVDSRGGIPNVLKSFIRKLEHVIINKAQATIVCTEDRIKQIEGSNPKKLLVIHNSPSVSDEKRKLLLENYCINYDQQRIVLTYVGGLSERRFIKTAIDVIKKYPHVTLNLAGMGNVSEYAKIISNEYSNINYFGMIDYVDALELYSKSDIMFAIYDPKVPNHKYSAPNKVYEAMMLGKPIIVAEGTGIDSIVKKNNNGLVINYSEHDFENTIISILNGKINLKELAENSKYAYEDYSWDQMRKRISKLYAEDIIL
jgi:glycosyltransferase involved in cell wall biosynthesis